MPGLMKTNIKSLPFLHRGKVRDIYAVGDDKMLVVQTDRLSAFDVIMEDPIPGKGRILTAMSNFWFKKFGKLMPNHMTDIDPESLVAPEEREQVRGRNGLERLSENRGCLRYQVAGRSERGAKTSGSDFHAFHQGCCR